MLFQTLLPLDLKMLASVHWSRLNVDYFLCGAEIARRKLVRHLGNVVVDRPILVHENAEGNANCPLQIVIAPFFIERCRGRQMTVVSLSMQVYIDACRIHFGHRINGKGLTLGSSLDQLLAPNSKGA